MKRAALLAALALLAAAPLRAQELPSHCTRETTREDHPPRGRAAREDSTRQALRRAVTEDLRATALAAGLETPKGIVLLLSDGRRRSLEAHALDGDLPDHVAAEVGRRALPRLATYPGRGRVVLPLRLDTVPAADAAPGAAGITCKPHLANRLLVQQRVQAFASANTHLFTADRRRRETEMGMLLGRDGRVLHAEVVRSSGDVRLDRFASDLAREMRFLPASVDGIPRDVWLVIPVGVAAPPRAPR